MTRKARIAVAIGVLVVLQAGAIAIHRAVERSREPSAAAVTFPVQRLAGSETAPTIVGRRSDGSQLTLAWPSPRARLVHFWATWCEPCLDELPSLLAFARDARDQGIEVVAIAVDDQWSDIARFFGGTVPPEVIVELAGATHKRFGVSTLPDTYLVDRAGQLVERYQGARDWSAPAARTHVLDRVSASP